MPVSFAEDHIILISFYLPSALWIAEREQRPECSGLIFCPAGCSDRHGVRVRENRAGHRFLFIPDGW